MEVPDSNNLRLDTFTICALFKSAEYDNVAIRPLAKKGYMFVWEKFNYAFNVRGPGLTYSLIIGDGTNYELLVSDQIEPGVWHFGCGIYDGSTLKIYHDGELLAEKNVGAITLYKSTDPLWVSRPSDALNGVVALVLVYNRALSQTEIKWNMMEYHNPVRDGLVLWLHDRMVGDTWHDESGYGNDGTIYGAVRKELAMWEIRSELGL